MAGRGVHLERPDAVAGRERRGRRGLGPGVAALQLRLRLAGVERLVLGEQARVAGGDQHLDARQRGGELVERADVVAVGVRQRDPHDRRAERRGGGEDPLVGARDERVDERQPVVLLHEIGVDEAELGDPINGHSSQTNTLSLAAS